MLAEKTSKPEARSEGKEWAISGFLLWMTALGKILQRNITGRKKERVHFGPVENQSGNVQKTVGAWI